MQEKKNILFLSVLKEYQKNYEKLLLSRMQENNQDLQIKKYVSYFM